MTINVLTEYQIEELKEKFLSGADITKLGICQENGHVILEYIGWRGSQTIVIAKSEEEQIKLIVDKVYSSPNDSPTEQLTKDELELLSPPGATILESMDALGVDMPLFCIRMGLTPETAQDLLTGKMILTPYIADQLEDILNIDTQFWLNLEANYRQKLQKPNHP
jgi:plasmid maintenance system antidote protein VapI